MLLNVILIGLLLLCLDVTANTEIINAGPIYCPSHSASHETADATLRSSLQISQSWPKLHLSDSTPTLFSIVPDWEQRARVTVNSGAADDQEQSNTMTVVAPRADEGYWIALHLSSETSTSANNQQQQQQQEGEPSLLQRVTWWLTRRFTIRVSWPANHPLDFHLTLHTPESMLRVGGRSVAEGQEQQVDSTDKGTSLCPVLYLHLYATSHGAKIPPAKKRSKGLTLTRWLLDAAETYMSPLYSEEINDGEETMQQGPTPIHVSFEPLILGILPRGLAVSAATLGGYVLAGWVALGMLGFAPQSPFEAAVHLLQRVYSQEATESI